MCIADDYWTDTTYTKHDFVLAAQNVSAPKLYTLISISTTFDLRLMQCAWHRFFFYHIIVSPDTLRLAKRIEACVYIIAF